MTKIFPYIELLHELEEAVQVVIPNIEPLHSYLYCLNAAVLKKDRLKPSGFYFLLNNGGGNCPSATFAIIDLYKDVLCLTIIISEIEKNKEKFSPFKALKSLLCTTFALKNMIPDISFEICKIKEAEGAIFSKQICKKLFLYTESVRAILEELITLKSILLEEILFSHNLFLTKEPLDLKQDLE